MTASTRRLFWYLMILHEMISPFYDFHKCFLILTKTRSLSAKTTVSSMRSFWYIIVLGEIGLIFEQICKRWRTGGRRSSPPAPPGAWGSRRRRRRGSRRSTPSLHSTRWARCRGSPDGSSYCFHP